MKIVVASCRAYSDAWNPFIKFFKKYWRNCAYDLELHTDSYSYDEIKDDWSNIISNGEDDGWCKNLYNTLTQSHDELTLFMQEDFFLTAPVDTGFISRAETLIKFNPLINCIRLYPCPGADTKWGDEFGLISDDAPYRVSCQSAIWRTSHLLELLKCVSTPWQFEIENTLRRPSGLYLSIYRDKYPNNSFPLQYYCTAIVRGKWQKDAIKHCMDNNVYVDLTRRPVESK
jgi:hypothetical protein